MSTETKSYIQSQALTFYYQALLAVQEKERAIIKSFGKSLEDDDIPEECIENEKYASVLQRQLLEDLLKLDTPNTPRLLTDKDFPLPEIMDFAKKRGCVFSTDRPEIPGLEGISPNEFDSCLKTLGMEGLGYFTNLGSEAHRYFTFAPYKGFEDGEPVYCKDPLPHKINPL